MENSQNCDNLIANTDSDGPLFKTRKRPKISPQTKIQNENKYQMSEVHGRDKNCTESISGHKYTTNCDSFIQDFGNGLITNSISDVLPESDLYDDAKYSSSKIVSHDDIKYENIELYTNFEPQEGRPILNTSMIRHSNLTQKGRSPLTSVGNQNAIQNNLAHRKILPTISSDETFNYYQRKMPQTELGVDHFSTLSYEMLLSIFQWLPKKALLRCSLVCRRFNEASQDESLWSRLDLVGRNLVAGALGRILRRGIVVIRLAQTKITSPAFIGDEANDIVFPKLQYLDLSMSSISQQSLAELLAKCEKLKKLSLETVPVNLAVCKGIAKNENLVALNLTMCTGLDESCISTFLPKLKCLESLNISWTSMTLATIEKFLQCAPESLLRLNIAGCRKSLSDLHIEKLVARCPNLLELDISDSVNLTSECINQMVKLKKLQFLSMSRCYNVTPTSYISLNDILKLECLDIFGVLSDDVVTMIQNRFPNVGINKFIHSAVARPTVGTRRSSIWGLRTRDQ